MRVVGAVAVYFLAACSADAANYYVSPSGDDSHDGLFSSPWQTINHAVNSARGGDTIYVRSGTYSERIVFGVSGAAGSPLTLRNFPGEQPIISGGSLTVGSGWDPLILIKAKSHIRVQGLEITNWKTSANDHIPIGILITASDDGAVGCEAIELANLRIHGIWQTYDDGTTWVSGSDAHGIAAYGNGLTEAAAISNLTVAHCELFDLKLGTSEGLVLNGNVTDFAVRNCLVYDCNNIGIDLIGFESTTSVESLDQARNGLVADCEVYSVSSDGNPGYRSRKNPEKFDLSAGGIYVDGGRDIVIERNRSHHNNIGIEVASEHAGKATSSIIVRSNFVHSNTDFTGLSIGGYDNASTGLAQSCQIIGNTFWGNDSDNNSSGWNGQIHMQWDVQSCIFQNNIIVANADTGIMIGDPSSGDTRPADNTFDRNLYYNPGTEPSVWMWKGNEKTFNQWKSATGGEANSINQQDPLLADPSNGDLRVQSGSPAENAGAVGALQPGSYDIGLEARQNGIIDIGADEIQPEVAQAAPRVDISADSDHLHIALETAPGLTYQLFESADLEEFSEISGEIITGDGTTRVFSLPRDFTGEPAGFHVVSSAR